MRAILKKWASEYCAERMMWFAGDRGLWVIVAALSIISILVVYSSTAKMAYDDAAIRSTSSFLQMQLVSLFIAAVVIHVAHNFNDEFYFRVTSALFYLSILLTFSAYFIGSTTNGAARWIPIFGFDLQPSEMLKVTTMMFVSKQLSLRQDDIADIRIIPSYKVNTWFSPEQRKVFREGFFPILFPVIAASGVVVFAHTSSAILIFGISFVLMWICRIRKGELCKLVAVAVVCAMIYAGLGIGRSATAGGRFSTWIEIWTSDRTHLMVNELSDTERAMIAIYNGGVTGVGAGKSAMRVEMIHPESDYAYAFFVEEYGSLLAVILMMLCVWIFIRSILIFENCKRAFPAFMVLGLGLMITCQSLLHIAVALNIAPETGQTLPIVSRGGSSLLFNAMALGLILGVSRQNAERLEREGKR